MVVATQGGGVDYGVYVSARIGAKGDLEFDLYLISAGEEGDTSSRALVDFQVGVIGEDLEGLISCEGGQGHIVVTESLAPGPARALEIDRISNRYSATNNFEPLLEGGESFIDTDAETPSTEGARATDLEAFVYSGSLWTWHEGETVPVGRAVNPAGDVYSEQCRIDSSLIWLTTDPPSPLNAPQSTLLAPQFNLTPVEEALDHQKYFRPTLRIDRVPGARLQEAYPQPEVESENWFLRYNPVLYGEPGEVSVFAYTDQPTLLFSNRDAVRRENTFLVFGGICVGFAIMLLVRGANDLVDLLGRPKGQAG